MSRYTEDQIARWRYRSIDTVTPITGIGTCQLPEFYVRQQLADDRLVPLLGENNGNENRPGRSIHSAVICSKCPQFCRYAGS